MTPAEHGAVIAGPSIAGGASSSNGGGWVTLVQAALSISILVALAILWWRTLRPEPSPGPGDGKP